MATQVLRAGKLVPRTRGRTTAWATGAAPVALITCVGAALRLSSFGRVPGNPFYDAAVRSMSLSWHNLFFGAMEPGGQVSVDKAPADLWLQVLAVKLFGFSGVTVRLPEAIAAIIAIPLLYDLVRRAFGHLAGVGAAAALALLPVAILTAHSDTMDALMMLLDVAAAWLVVVGAQRSRLWLVAAAGAVLGLAFNVKLFEALVVLPALLVLIALALPSVRERLIAAGAFLGALVVVGLSWISVASLTPAAHRPWPFGSADGSIWNVVFSYNGVHRVTGTASAAARRLDPPGALRLFSGGGHQYLSTVGTMLLAAVVLPAVALLAARGRRPAQRLAMACGAFFGAWLLTGVALLSHMQRLEPRYLETVTPAIAAAVGIGAAAAPAAAGAAVVAVAAIALAQPPLWAAGLALAGVAACALAAWRGWPRAALVSGCLVAVLAVPANAALSVAREHRSDAGLASRWGPAQLAALSAFLTTHAGSRYEVASSSIDRATPLIVHDARPVLMLTGEGGRPLVSPERLSALVTAGTVRYGLLAHGHAAVLHWALAHSRDVSAAAGLPAGTLYRLTATAHPPAAG